MMCVVIVGCGLLWPDSNENAKDKKITAALPFSRNRENAISNFVSPIQQWRTSLGPAAVDFLVGVYWGSQLPYNRQNRSCRYIVV